MPRQLIKRDEVAEKEPEPFVEITEAMQETAGLSA